MKCILSLALAVIAVSALIDGNSASKSCEKTQFVCYYGSWATYRQGNAKFTVKDIDPFVCTHVIYTFVGLSEYSGEVIYLDSYLDLSDDWHQGALDLLNDLKKQNPALKTMIAVGGWNEGSEKYSKVCHDPFKRKAFVTTAIDMVVKHNLNGFDLDWEYPAQRGGAASDRECFSVLVKELREECNRRGLNDILLSAAVSANKAQIPYSYEPAVMSKYLDFINVMSYDLHGSWEKETNHHAALNSHSCENPLENYLNMKSAIESWIENGADPCKLNLGLASYGRSFQLATPTDKCEVCAPAIGPYRAGEYVGESGFLPYSEICRKIKEQNWKVCFSGEQEVPFAVNHDLWVGYDDPASLVNKVNWAKSINLGGVMIWSIETDDNLGLCGQGRFPLCNAIKSAWFSDKPLPTAPPTSAPNPTTTTTTTTSTTTTSRPETTTLPTSAPSQTTSNGDEFSTNTTPNFDDDDTACKNGKSYFRDPKDCAAFYSCAPGYKSNKFLCAAGLYFDPENQVCNWIHLVKCNDD